MPSPFDRFRTKRRSDLSRIARATRGEYTADDLTSESWILADTIASRRGWEFDWDSEDDQETILGWMHSEFVRFADKSVRFAVKLDKDWDNDDGGCEPLRPVLANLPSALARAEARPNPSNNGNHSVRQKPSDQHRQQGRQQQRADGRISLVRFVARQRERAREFFE